MNNYDYDFAFKRKIDEHKSGENTFDSQRRVHAAVVDALDDLAQVAPRGITTLSATVEHGPQFVTVTVRGRVE